MTSKEAVKNYYGKVLQKSKDLKTNACKTSSCCSSPITPILKKIHPEVLDKYYGCGLVFPSVDIKGKTVLDLGCGAGRDCYVLSFLVGENGFVVGVDMTDEQLNVAEKYIEFHMKEFGYAKPNVSFKKGYIENLAEVGIETESVDLIVSNCVINLSPDKKAVFKEAFRVLQNGGEMYFSDIYSDQRIPEELVRNEVLFGECISGALFWNDFLTITKAIGFKAPAIVEKQRVTIENKELETLVGDIKFDSVTVKLVKDVKADMSGK